MSTSLDSEVAPVIARSAASDTVDTIREVYYETGYGYGLLVWRGGILVSHRLPSRGKSAIGNREVVAYHIDIRAGDASRGETRRPGENRPPAESCLITLLQSYFSGNPVDFDALNLPLDFSTYSEFELHIVKELAAVPFGETLSYAELAARAGHPRAHRAAGGVMARNPYPLILPCHRVIRSNGSLGNFSGGIGWKQRMLKLEGLDIH